MSKQEEKSGLTTAGLVLGIIGTVLAFIPIINNIAFILGILALIFAIVVIIQKHSNGKNIAALVLGIMAILITLAMQSAAKQAIDEISSSLDEVSNSLDAATGNKTDEILGRDVEITLGSFSATTDQYGFVSTVLPVTIKNLLPESKSYSVHIEAIDSEGNRIDDESVYASSLSQNQSQDFKTFNIVTSDKVERLKTATFRILEVSEY